jgi:cytochrome c553
MNNGLRVLVLVGSVWAALGTPPKAAQSAFPAWAYPVDVHGMPAPPDDGTAKRVPGSAVGLTRTQISDLFRAPDWHPSDHPPMPDVVAFGRKPGVFACGYCHLPNGLGRPENSSLAGLPVEYIVQQVDDFKSGARRSSEPASLPTNFMMAIAQTASQADVRAAAEYFAALRPTRWIRVIESANVPKTHVAGWMRVASEPLEWEPIGQRIIEVPQDLERTELRDARSGFIAYVPVGSIAKGKALAAGGSGGSVACSVCHGADLKGLGPVPALAGRSPSYVMRQLYDIKKGVRHGLWSALMRPIVGRLGEEEMVALVAYTASLAP